MKFNNLHDVIRYLSDLPIDESQYVKDVYENVATDFINLLKKEYGFSYGEEMPEISENIFWSLWKEYEVIN